VVGPTGNGSAPVAGAAGVKGTGTFGDGVQQQGNGAAGVGDSTAGATGSNYGGGGSGGKANAAANRAGGAGAGGVVVLVWTPASLKPWLSRFRKSGPTQGQKATRRLRKRI
jgi:hypothetical protein